MILEARETDGINHHLSSVRFWRPLKYALDAI